MSLHLRTREDGEGRIPQLTLCCLQPGLALPAALVTGVTVGRNTRRVPLRGKCLENRHLFSDGTEREVRVVARHPKQAMQQPRHNHQRSQNQTMLSWLVGREAEVVRPLLWLLEKAGYCSVLVLELTTMKLIGLQQSNRTTRMLLTVKASTASAGWTFLETIAERVMPDSVCVFVGVFRCASRLHSCV